MFVLVGCISYLGFLQVKSLNKKLQILTEKVIELDQVCNELKINGGVQTNQLDMNNIDELINKFENELEQIPNNEHAGETNNSQQPTEQQNNQIVEETINQEVIDEEVIRNIDLVNPAMRSANIHVVLQKTNFTQNTTQDDVIVEDMDEINEAESIEHVEHVELVEPVEQTELVENPEPINENAECELVDEEDTNANVETVSNKIDLDLDDDSTEEMGSHDFFNMNKQSQTKQKKIHLKKMYKKKTKKELQELLKKYNQSLSGNKSELVERLLKVEKNNTHELSK